MCEFTNNEGGDRQNYILFTCSAMTVKKNKQNKK